MAAVREAKEETGLDVEVGEIIGVYTGITILKTENLMWMTIICKE